MLSDRAMYHLTGSIVNFYRQFFLGILSLVSFCAVVQGFDGTVSLVCTEENKDSQECREYAEFRKYVQRQKSAEVLEASASLGGYCQTMFAQAEDCPEEICQMRCREGFDAGAACAPACLPNECPDIDAQHCPLKFCAVMTNCSEETICHFPMVGEKIPCGDLAYAGQDVECCDGLVRRCGYEFLDGTCDMQGRNSVYSLPICVPCGDGVCNQFEDRCNCPEDCGTPPDFMFDEKTLNLLYLRQLPSKRAQ
jgi:hypothetical protein